jgi:predicted nucleic acid-binding protein
MIVVDASVAAKWYLHEQGSEDASALLTTPQPLVAPSLIRVEVTGAIVRRHREGLLSRERVFEACELWEADLARGAVRLIPTPQLLPAARRIAVDIRHPIQDCLYLAAALANHGVPLVTADRKFHDRAGPAFPFVELRGAAWPQ